ncbi:hypothetical protein H7J82_24620 [Mycolicibacterium poriferae]|uniref:Ig-like domain-containing protein n=1 Tax=Mycolicibacterium poriferae TaxID=39694 RepID=UPI0021F34562|nr:hypothetical protein [Mycolicibacterium poriferae]MCV7266187.1 hypothetical protein [Mycolicibacterium poriferae]
MNRDSADELAVSAPEAGESVETVNVVSALVSNVVSPFADPEAPAPAPWLDAVLAWVRRQIEHTFFNKSPVFGPIESSQILTGQVLFDLNESDPNGDPLTYTIIQPEHGLVIRELITGKFVYTPTSIVAGDPLTDSFQVVISDSSEHLTGTLGAIQKVLHGIARLFGLAEADEVTVTVPVTVNPIVQLPPVIVTVGAPIFSLGGDPVKVVSSVTITDADSDRLSEATVKILTAGKASDVLDYEAQEGNPITASWDAATRTLTLSGLATKDQYEQALKAVTFSTTEGGLPRGISISVTDEHDIQSVVPGAALVTVIGLPPGILTVGTPIFTLGKSPVKVFSSVTITDLDSDELSEATVKILTAGKGSDVLGYVAPDGNPITASWDAATRTLTLSGAATVDQYEQALKAVTFSTTEGGLPRGLSVSLVDDAGVASLVPGAAVVTVIGLPPIIATLGTSIFTLGKSPVKVLSSVTITDLDSDELSEATIKILTAGKSTDVLDYVAPDGNPITASWDAASRTLTLSGAATKDQYEEALKAVTFSTTEGGLPRGLSVSLVDDAGVASLVPGAAVVTVIGLPPGILTLGTSIFTLGKSPVKVLSSVTITDLDSDELSEATVKILTAGKSTDVLDYVAPDGNPITASWDAASRTLTLSGAATKDQYEEALKAVTFSTTEGGLPRGLSVSLVDDAGVASLVPGAAVVTVIGLPPGILTVGTPIFTLGKSPVKVLSSVTITDLDSDELSEATVKILTAGKSTDVLDYVAPDGNPIAASWDAATRTLTLSGAATIDQYEQALKAVTFSTTEGGLPRGLSVSLVDDAGVASLVPGAAVVTVIGLPPGILTVGTPIFTLGKSPVKVLSSVTITDLDSDELSEATVKILTAGKAEDVLSYSAIQGNPITASWDAATQTLTLSGAAEDVLSYSAIQGNPITASWDAATQTLTLSGAATKDQYEDALKAVTFSTTEGGLPRGLSVSLVDDAGVASLVPGAAVVTVIGLPPIIATLGTSIFTLGKSPVKVFSSVTITDLDSDELSEATVKILTAGKAEDVLSYSAIQGNPITASWDAATQTLTLSGAAEDVLSYSAIQGNPITASWDAATQTLTLSGAATKDQYEDALKAVTFSTTEGGLPRGLSVSLVDDAGVSSVVPGAAVVTVIGLPPIIATLGASIFTLGKSPVKVLSSVTITDLDSDELSEATVKILTAGKAEDVLSYSAIQGNPIVATWDAETRTLTLSGLATKDQYEEALKAVTFSTTEGGLPRGLSVSLVDDAGVSSVVPGAAVVTVIGLPPGILTAGASIFTLGKSPVKVLSSVTITDLDSDELSEATVKILTAGKSQDVLGYNAIQGNPITATWDAATQTLTLSGLATKDQYEEALKAVTFSTTEGGLPRGLSVSLVDDAGVSSVVPGAAVVTVIGLPPGILTVGTPIFTLGKSPVKVLSSVTITDLDSDELSQATVKILTAGKPQDVLGYNAIQGNPITATWDAATQTLTLSGAATKDQYEEALQAVTFSTTEGGLPRGLSVSLVDDAGVSSVVPGAAVVTVIGLPPGILTAGASIFMLGKSPVKVLSSVTITDLDSDELSEATVKIVSAGKDADVLSYSAIQGNPITATWDAATRTLTLSGAATKDQYEEALKAVTFSTTEGGIARGLSVSLVDDAGVASLVPGAAVVTVIGLPPGIAVFGAPIHTIGTAPVKLVSSATITDLDSDQLSKAVLKIATLAQDGDVLGYVAPNGDPITASWDAASKTLTLSGVATKAQYEQAIEAVTFSATGGILAVRSVTISLTDETGVNTLIPASVLAGARYSLAPTVAPVGAPTYTIGKAPVRLIGAVDVGDLDSDYMSKATLKITLLAQSGDTLGYVAPNGNPITASWDAGSKTLTLQGVATKAQYEEALKAVTFSATGGALLVRTVSVNVVDDTGVESVLPGTVLANVANPLPPLVTPVGRLLAYGAGNSPVNPITAVDIADADSDYMFGATVQISDNYNNGDVLGYVAPANNPITASWNASTQILTLSGTATKAQYEAALKAVTFYATTPGGLWNLGEIRTIRIAVTDDSNVKSLAAFVPLGVTI